jgi:nickel-dependent lactate racemase
MLKMDSKVFSFPFAPMNSIPRFRLATWGNMIDNPLQVMAKEVNLLCMPDFLLNVTLNGQEEITGVFAGELFEAHAQGCTYTKEHAKAMMQPIYSMAVCI